VVPTLSTPVGPPWNAQQMFEPSPLPDLTDPATREEVAPEDLPVRSRQQPGYETVGIRAGSWMFNPSITTGTLFDSNVFSSNVDRRADIAAMVQPTLRASTLWERHGLNLSLGAQSYFYRDNPGLDQTNAGVKGNGWIDVSHDAKILTSFQASHLHEGVGTLSSPAGAVKPTPYDLLSGDITYRQEFNRLAASVGLRIDSYSFGSTVSQNGSVIDQDNRDGQIYRAHSRIDYAFSPMLGFFTSVEGNQRDLRGTPDQPLKSNGYRVLAGANVEFTHLITGEVAAGYASQQFDPATIGLISGPAYRAMLTWRPTRLIDVNFRAEQIVTESSDTSATGVLADSAQIGVDYELRRNVIVSALGAYERERFFGQSRTDRVLVLGAQLKYLMNRFSYITLEHKYFQRDSSIPIFSFDKQQVSINVTAQF
jgi:hypothetical protein